MFLSLENTTIVPTISTNIIPEDIGVFPSVLEIFKPKKNPKIEVEIRTINEENLEETSNNLAHIFAQYEPLTIKEDIKKQYLYDNFILPLGKLCMRDNLGITAYNRSNGEWIGACFAEDVLSSLSEQYVKDPDNKLLGKLNLLTLIDKYEQQIVGRPKKRFEMIRLVLIGINPEYSSMGISQEMMRFFMHEHSLIKNSKTIIAECTNIVSKKVLEAVGWKVNWEMTYAEIGKIDKRLEVFGDTNEFMRKRGLDIAEKCYFMSYIHHQKH